VSDDERWALLDEVELLAGMMREGLTVGNAERFEFARSKLEWAVNGAGS
jgi:hypothetical protein